jgi:hypothetical protein
MKTLLEVLQDSVVVISHASKFLNLDNTVSKDSELTYSRPTIAVIIPKRLESGSG